MENSKLITSQDVQFFEDSSPSELAVIDIGAPIVLTGDLNDFIDDTINREANQQDTHQDSKSSHNISEIPTVLSTDCTTTPTNNEPNYIPAAPPPASKKPLKWNNLPKRDVSNCT